ncbi:unnamed protein product [Danaus chrysippus]|uniref:(African queen) hypothetical protein n=1 Tax=Danaus chrysippus TaxID=151541 RepID=A0A8J2R7Q5_9NEOP|nr:unnamed protein product [Danaus chrysippus]
MMRLTWSAQKRRGGDGRLRVRAARRYNGGNSSACTVPSPQSSLPSELRMLRDADRLLVTIAMPAGGTDLLSPMPRGKFELCAYIEYRIECVIVHFR